MGAGTKGYNFSQYYCLQPYWLQRSSGVCVSTCQYANLTAGVLNDQFCEVTGNASFCPLYKFY